MFRSLKDDILELDKLGKPFGSLTMPPPILFKSNPDRSRWEDTGEPRIAWPFPKSSWLQQKRRELAERKDRE